MISAATHIARLVRAAYVFAREGVFGVVDPSLVPPPGHLALKEAFRVLRPGGRFLCLEFSTVDVPGLDRLYDMFSFRVIPPLGRAVTGDTESYQYLVESIRKFPKPDAFAEMIRAAGFSRVSHQTLSGGIVALHSGWRL